MKYFGKIGFAETKEVRPGYSEYKIIERQYYGEVLRNTRKFSMSQNTSLDDIDISNELSILADNYMNEHIGSIKYVEWYGTKWKVNNIEFGYPRIQLSIGGVYNGPQA